MGAREGIHYSPQAGASVIWARMPGLDRVAVSHAVQKLSLVRSFLAGARSEIACFHIETKRRRRQYSCTLWRGTLSDGYEIVDGSAEMTHGMLSEICGALAPLARDLAARWPDRARPSTIGIATDGHRIVFNAEHPSCTGDAWLAAHLSGRSPGTLIADDGKGGVLTRICP